MRVNHRRKIGGRWERNACVRVFLRLSMSWWVSVFMCGCVCLCQCVSAKVCEGGCIRESEKDRRMGVCFVFVDECTCE